MPRGRPRKKRKPKTPDYEALILSKIEECNEVLRHLDSCPSWQIIVKDLEGQRQLIDANWHLTLDEKKLQEFRVTKFAVMHLLEIKDKYAKDLEHAQTELRKYSNQDSEIMKDYDTETNVER